MYVWVQMHITYRAHDSEGKQPQGHLDILEARQRAARVLTERCVWTGADFTDTFVDRVGDEIVRVLGQIANQVVLGVCGCVGVCRGV